MSECEVAILSYLSSSENATIEDSHPWALSQSLPHASVVGAIKSLSAEFYITPTERTKNYYELTKEAVGIMESGSPEYITFSALVKAGDNGLDMNELSKQIGKVAKLGMGKCLQNKWIAKQGATLVATKTLDEVTDDVPQQLKVLSDNDGIPPPKEDDKTKTLSSADLKLLTKRKLIKAKKLSSYTVTRGPSYAPKRIPKEADLTKELLDSGAWKTSTFKSYNFKTLGEFVGGGYLHPLLKVRAEYRKILLQMGFEEMPTQKWVESSFWNFDALFQPQSHPARDAHDTFFIKSPAETVSVPEEYYERVKTMHEVGGSGSIGYRYAFKKEGTFQYYFDTMVVPWQFHDDSLNPFLLF